MIYAVVDTNVLVSAMFAKHSDSATVLVIQKILDGAITPVISQEIVDEYLEVLQRPRFKFDPNIIKERLLKIQQLAIYGKQVPYDAEMPDEKDRVFYEVSLSVDGSYLVTGNQKHFPITPQVVTPSEMLAIIEQKF